MSERYQGDPGNALYMNDGPPPHWWTSADVRVNGAGSEAHEGTNTVHVVLRMHAEKTFEGSTADAEVFVGNPSLVMTPNSGTKRIGAVSVSKDDLAAQGEVPTTLPWEVRFDSGNPDRPDQPGHRCLIARIHPFDTVVPNDFRVPDDQHEVQRNIVIARTATRSGASPAGAGAGMVGTEGGDPLGPGPDGLWAFQVDTTSPFEDREDQVTIRATWAPNLPDEVYVDVAEVLKESGFQGYAPVPPEYFVIEPDARRIVRGPSPVRAGALPRLLERWPLLPDRLRRLLRRLPLLARGVFSSEVELWVHPHQVTRSTLRVEPWTTTRGQAQVFHLEQVGSGRESQGGLTLVLLPVD